MLPDFGWTELLVIAIVLIVVVGPKDLPRVLRGFSKTLGSARKMAGDFRKQFDDALSEAELDDLKTLASDVKSMDPRNSIKDALTPLSDVGREINDELKGIAKSADGELDEPKIEPPKKVVTPDEHYPQLAKIREERKAEAAIKAQANAAEAGVKKAPAKKADASKTVSKQTSAARKTATAKAKAAPKNTARKTASKKPAAKKTTPRKAPVKKPAPKAEDKA